MVILFSIVKTISISVTNIAVDQPSYMSGSPFLKDGTMPLEARYGNDGFGAGSVKVSFISGVCQFTKKKTGTEMVNVEKTSKRNVIVFVLINFTATPLWNSIPSNSTFL